MDINHTVYMEEYISNAFDKFGQMYCDIKPLTATEIQMKKREAKNPFEKSMSNYLKALQNHKSDNSNFNDFLSKEEMEIK